MVRLLWNRRHRLQLLQDPMQAASDHRINLAGHALRRYSAIDGPVFIQRSQSHGIRIRPASTQSV